MTPTETPPPAAWSPTVGDTVWAFEGAQIFAYQVKSIEIDKDDGRSKGDPAYDGFYVELPGDTPDDSPVPGILLRCQIYPTAAAALTARLAALHRDVDEAEADEAAARRRRDHAYAELHATVMGAQRLRSLPTERPHDWLPAAGETVWRITWDGEPHNQLTSTRWKVEKKWTGFREHEDWFQVKAEGPVREDYVPVRAVVEVGLLHPTEALAASRFLRTEYYRRARAELLLTEEVERERAAVRQLEECALRALTEDS